MKKTKFILYILMFLVTITGALAFAITDNFNDGVIDPLLWDYDDGVGNLFLTEEAPVTIEYSQVNISPSKDTYIDDDAPDNNYGTSQWGYVETDGGGKLTRVLMEFDTSVIEDFTNATLEIFIDAGKEEPLTENVSIVVYRLTQNWTHYGSTWKTYDGVSEWTLEGADGDYIVFNNSILVGANDYNITLQFDLTDMVNGWVNGTYANNGIIIMMEDQEEENDRGRSVALQDNTDSSIRPKLIIDDVDYIVSADGFLKIAGNNSGAFTPNWVWATTKKSIGVGENGTFTFSVNDLTKFSNENSWFTIGNWESDQSPDGHPYTTCGLNLQKSGTGTWRFYSISAYPSIYQIWNSGISDFDVWHDVSVEVERVGADTKWTINFDGNITEWTETSSHCSGGKTINFSMIASAFPSATYSDTRLDDFSMFSDEPATCEEPCIKNETFGYSDSLCNHNGWIAGDCNDINVPYGNQYVCDDSDEVLAKYFGLVTKESLQLTMDFDLQINSDYDILLGHGSQDSVLASLIKFDNGIIREMRDNNVIGSYNYGDMNTYTLIFDLDNFNFDLWKNGILESEDVPFYNNVDNLYYFFLQPDYVKGDPYCDYVLDNIVLTKGLASAPQQNVTNFDFGCMNLRPSDPSFDYTCCKEGENAYLCIARVTFEHVGEGAAEFFFNNFLIFLVLVIIIVVVVLIRRKP